MGSVMSVSQSQLLSLKPSTTALARGKKWWRGASGRRERCTRGTTLYGARRHLSCWKRPAPLSEVAGPQVAVTGGNVVASVPLLGAPSMADSSAEAIDGSTLSFLLQHALEVKRKEEEEAVEAAELAELEEKVAVAECRLLAELQREREEATCITRRTWAALSGVEQYAVLWSSAKEKVKMRKGEEEKEEENKDKTDEALLAGFCDVPLVSGSHLFLVSLRIIVFGFFLVHCFFCIVLLFVVLRLGEFLFAVRAAFQR